MYKEGVSLTQIDHLPIDLPPFLEETLGYNGEARYVAFYWGRDDEAYFYDGYLRSQAEWDAYLVCVRHPLIEPALRDYHFGSSEEQATHWLLLDREQRQLLVAPVALVEFYLQQQWGTPEPEQVVVVVDQDAWNLLIADVTAGLSRIKEANVFAALIEHQQLVQELASWLETKWLEHSSL